jgi:hypothetical protein
MRSLIKGDQKICVYHQNMNGCPVTSGDTFTNDRVNPQVLFAAISGAGFPVSFTSNRTPWERGGNRTIYCYSGVHIGALLLILAVDVDSVAEVLQVRGTHFLLQGRIG